MSELQNELLSSSLDPEYMEAEEDSIPTGNPREQMTVGDDGHFYNNDGERVYYWAPPFEMGEEGGENYQGSETAGIGENPGGYFTEDEIRAYWDDGSMDTFKSQHDMGWEDYWAYLNERQGFIESGELADPTGFMNDAINANRDPCSGLTGREEEVCRARNDAAIQETALTSMVDWLGNDINKELADKYGIQSTYVNEDGDEYRWNGSSYVKYFKDPGVDWGRFAASVMGTAFGAALAPGLVAGLGLTGGTSAGVAKGVISSVIGQGISTGKIDPGSVAIGGILGGMNAFIDDLIVGGDLIDEAGNFTKLADNTIWDLSHTLGLSYQETAEIIRGVMSGVISGADLEGIVTSAVGAWAGTKLENWIKSTLGDSGIDVDNWFRDGNTNISSESIAGLARNGFDALISGGLSESDALKALYDFFNDGGSLDFMLPGLLDIGGADFFDFSFCDEDELTGEKPWYCGIRASLPDICEKNEDGEKPWYCEGVDVDITCPDGFKDENGVCVPIGNPCGEGYIWDMDIGECIPDINITCPEGFQNEDGECVPIDINITCPDGFRDENGVCVPIGNPCGEGYIWDIELGECVPDVSITCPDGFKDENGVCVPIGNPCGDGYIWDADLGECVPDVNIPCPEGWDRDEDGICIEPPVVCGEGYSWDQDLGECVPDFDDLCPPGFERDELTGKCLEIECPEGWDKDEDGICIEPPQPCSDGYSWDPNLGECVENKREPCPEGQERNALGQCVEPTKKCAEGQRLIDGECVDINTPNIELPTITPPEGGGGMFNTKWSALEWQNTAPKPYRPATLTPYERLRNSLISSKKPNGGMFS